MDENLEAAINLTKNIYKQENDSNWDFYLENFSQ